MGLIPILPSLQDIEGGLHKPEKPGWDFRPVSELKTIANSLSVSLRPGFSSYAIDAIPDLWARLLLFDFALREPNHPLHEASISAFQGFLSFLALLSGSTAVKAIDRPSGDQLNEFTPVSMLVNGIASPPAGAMR